MIYQPEPLYLLCAQNILDRHDDIYSLGKTLKGLPPNLWSRPQLQEYLDNCMENVQLKHFTENDEELMRVVENLKGLQNMRFITIIRDEDSRNDSRCVLDTNAFIANCSQLIYLRLKLWFFNFREPIHFLQLNIRETLTILELDRCFINETDILQFVHLRHVVYHVCYNLTGITAHSTTIHCVEYKACRFLDYNDASQRLTRYSTGNVTLIEFTLNVIHITLVRKPPQILFDVIHTGVLRNVPFGNHFYVDTPLT